MITVRSRRDRARKRWHGFAALLATIAIGLQCFLVQTHVDLAPFDAGAAHAEVALSASHSSTSLASTSLVAESNGKGSAPCIICQELALAGAFLHAAPPALVLVEHTLSFTVPLQTARAVLAPPAHPWQSRAPPTSL